MLELLLPRDLAKESVGREQHAVVEKDVVDPDHAGLVQRDVVGLGRSLEHLQAQAEVRVVIEVGAGRHRPVDEAVFDERYETRHPEPGRRERAGDAHPDHHVGLEHFLGEQPASLAQAPPVVG